MSIHGFSRAAELIAQVETEQVEEALRWLSLPPLWVVVLLIVPACIGFVAFFYRRESPVGARAWRWFLGSIRAAILLLVLAMLAQPARRKTTYETRDSTVLVLADDSLSMDIADRYSNREIPEKLADMLDSSAEVVEGMTRYDIVRRLLADESLGFLEKLRSKGRMVVSTFARTAEQRAVLPRHRAGEAAPPGDPPLADVLPPYTEVRDTVRVQETRIAEGLRDAVSSAVGSGFGEREERVAAVLLVSDGRENAGSVSAVDVARRLGERGTPIHSLGLGNPDEPRDLRVVSLDVSDVVLVDDQVPFDVAIVAEGFDGERVPVRLSIDSQVVDTQYVVLEGGGKSQRVRLEHRPRKPGEIAVTVEIDKLGGEVFYDNNSLSTTVRVLDEKIRILYLENLPRWEYRYLKNALVRDSTMETQVWLFSADPDFVQESSPAVPPLRSLPRTRQELLRYHVIIIGDVAPEDLGNDVAELLGDFVEEGGGLVFISGKNSNPRKYAHSPLYSLLPVEVQPLDQRSEIAATGPTRESYKVELTAEGKELPLMRLDNDPARNSYLWENEQDAFYNGLPAFFSFVEVEKEKASAIVLARHPRRENPIQKKGRVIFAYMNYGKGRSFFSAVDDTWRWRAGVDNLYFYRFWGQVIRFVAAGRLLGKTPRFAVSTDKSIYNIGDEVKIDARVFDANMKPATDRTVTVYHQLQGREGEAPEKIELALNEVKGQGSYEGVLQASLRGRHDLWLGSETERAAFRSFSVEIPALESRDTRLNRALLERIARASGGEYHDFHEVLQVADRIQGVTRSQEGLVESDDLWDEWWVPCLLTGLLCLEWILRRRVRLL